MFSTTDPGRYIWLEALYRQDEEISPNWGTVFVSFPPDLLETSYLYSDNWQPALWNYRHKGCLRHTARGCRLFHGLFVSGCKRHNLFGNANGILCIKFFVEEELQNFCVSIVEPSVSVRRMKIPTEARNQSSLFLMWYSDLTDGKTAMVYQNGWVGKDMCVL